MNALLEAGADARDEDGDTALLIAARERHTDIENALLEAGADVTANDRCRRNSLFRQSRS